MTSKSALQTWQDRLEFLNRERAIAASADIKFQLDAQIVECEQKIRELSEKIVNDSSTESSSASERGNPVQIKKNMAVNPPVDFVVITALEEERKAFLRQLPQSRKLPPMSQAGLIGKSHNAYLGWLLNTWMSSSSSPVCFLEGFPGTGKTTIARELLARIHASKRTAIMITAPETEADPTDSLLLDLAMELNSAGRDELAKAIENNRSLLDVLRTIVRDPILIIIDEFQRSMQGTRAITLGGFANVLNTLASQKSLKGRILLLTNRLVERARWSESYAIRTLSGMSPDDGMELLEYLLQEDERSDEIAPERRHDVVKWLGGNPRAIKLLVRSLAYDSLDDLIGIQPELWEIRDQEVSADLVDNLEHQILEKTLNQLSDTTLLCLYSLAVHRKPFKRQAIEYLFTDKGELARFKRDCIDRFLMEQHNSWFSLHPIVREISLQKLGQLPNGLQQAHSTASRYYTRHFEAKEIVGWGALGGYFVESRYHLVKAERPDDLKNIVPPFRNHIFSTLSGSPPIPHDPEELAERIAVLSALLETPGPKMLEGSKAVLQNK